MVQRKISAIIVDDEMNARENLTSMLTKHCPIVNIVGEASGIQDAFDLIQKTSPELLFLDIKLSDKTSFQLLEMLKTHHFGVIFITAYDHYAIKAIKFSAVDYLLKPIDYKELKSAVKKYTNRSVLEKKVLQLQVLIENLSKDRKYGKLSISMDGRTEIVAVKEILRLEAESNYTRLFFRNGESILASKTLVEFEDLLHDIGFMRTHKTHMVNLSYVKILIKKDDWKIMLEGNYAVPVSRRRRAKVSNQLNQNNRLQR